MRRQRGKGFVLGPPKSRHSRRDLPIPVDLADRLTRCQTLPDRPVFTSKTGGLLDPDNLDERVLRPACEEAGVS